MVRVAVISEFYPSTHDPVLGVWAHQQTLATQAAGAEVVVLALRRPIPPLSTCKQGIKPALRETKTLLREPRRQMIDTVPVVSVNFLSPPRPRFYHTWGSYAAAPLAIALRKLRREFAFDIIHAHNAIPAADAVCRGRLNNVPLVTSVHGGDVFYTAKAFPRGKKRVLAALEGSDHVLANSTTIMEHIVDLGVQRENVTTIHLGAPIPPSASRSDQPPTLVTLAHLIPRKRHVDVLHAVKALKQKWPKLRYHIIGDGPQQQHLKDLARELTIEDHVNFFGQLPHREATALAQKGTIFVLPSTDEAFGVAYIEAMAGGLPVIGVQGEAGPDEICKYGEGLIQVPAHNPQAITETVDKLLTNPKELAQLGQQARATVQKYFSWERCGQTTLNFYNTALSKYAR